MSAVPRCTVCDTRIDAYGRDGTRCIRCKAPCTICGLDLTLCSHPLPEPMVEVEALGRGRIAA